MFVNMAGAQTQRPPQTVSRQKHMLKIIDPNTGKDVILESADHSGGSSDSGSRSTPVSGGSLEVGESL